MLAKGPRPPISIMWFPTPVRRDLDIETGFIHLFPFTISHPTSPLQWRNNRRDGVSNHQRHHCLLNRRFGRKSKKTSKLRVTGLCVRGIHRSPVNSPHTWPVMRIMFPFYDVIMLGWFNEGYSLTINRLRSNKQVVPEKSFVYNIRRLGEYWERKWR